MKLKIFNKERKEKELKNKLNRETNVKKRTVVLSVAVLLVGIILFTYARYESNRAFTLVSGTVGDFSGDVKIMSYMYDDGSGTVSNHDVPPAKNSGYVIDSVTCDNGTGSWDSELWGITISNLTGKAKCNISFTKLIYASEVNTTTEGKTLQQAIDELAAIFN